MNQSDFCLLMFLFQITWYFKIFWLKAYKFFAKNGIYFDHGSLISDSISDINDISSDIESKIRLFADDCVCYREIKDEKDTMKLQRDIDRLGSWARKWGMRFQPVKCNMMQLTRKRIKKIHASYTLEGTNLENVESIKYLGVTITSDLRWNTHVSNVCTKANRTLGFWGETYILAPRR